MSQTVLPSVAATEISATPYSINHAAVASWPASMNCFAKYGIDKNCKHNQRRKFEVVNKQICWKKEKKEDHQHRRA
jgi:hypothetical protein